MRAWWIGLVALVACGGADKSGDSGDTDTGGADTTDTDTPTGPTVETTARLTGTISGPGGLLEGANIRFCRGTQCRYATTDGAGAYDFPEAAVAWHSLEVVPPEGSGLATGFAPLQLGSNESRTIDLVLPALDTSSPLAAGASEHELGDGLLVTFGADDIEPPLFVDEATSTAGVQVAAAEWPPIDAPDGVSSFEPVAVWYTVPFDHHAVDPAGLPVRIENLWGLSEGATYEVYVGSYAESAWVSAGTVTVGADGFLTGDAALPHLSTVILVPAA